MDPPTVYASKRICQKHFDQKYISTRSNRLHLNAVPTLYLQDENVQLNPDVPSTSATVPLTQPLTLVLPSESQNEHAVECLTSPLQLLKQSGISKQTLTSREKKLYTVIRGLHKKIHRINNSKQSFRRRLSEAEEYQKNHQLEDNMGKLNSMAALFIRCQFREANQSKKLRRFSLDEKLLSLTLYKQSPKSYTLLSKIFILPSKSTLRRLLAQVVGGPGIKPVIFESLKEVTKKMDPSEKYVAVLFDEMAIMPGLHFNENNGCIDGFEEMGDNQRDIFFADHVLMFMVRGLKKQWKAPISYHFSSRGGAKTWQIKQLLIKIVIELIKINLKPLTVICDQNNVGVLNCLINGTKEKYLRCGKISNYQEGSFEIDDFIVFPILDPPHLLKGMRNNLIKKDLYYMKNNVKKTAKWEHIQKLYEHDNGPIDGLKVLPHITDEHIYEKKLKKMKVKNAAQIFSQRFAATLNLASQIDTEKKIGTCIEETAELLFFFDQLFDSLNGSTKHPEKGKILRCGLTNTSDHLQFWNNEALPLLKTMEFERKTKNDQRRPPSLKNFSFVIKNVQAIWQILQLNGFQYLLTRRLNQDPLENTFGQLRSFGAQNTNPSAFQFTGVFKTLYFNSAISFYKKSFNCEDDRCENMFISLKKLFISDISKTDTDQIIHYPDLNSNQSLTLQDKLNELSTNYVAGFILKKIKKKIQCPGCKNNLLSSDYSLSQNQLISAREYGGDWARRLCYPTLSFVSSFHNILKIINYCLDNHAHSRFLVQKIEEIVRNEVNFDFLVCDIEMHRLNIICLVLKYTNKTILHNWCKNVGKILQGKCRSYTGTNKVKIEAKKNHSNRIKKNIVKKPV